MTRVRQRRVHCSDPPQSGQVWGSPTAICLRLGSPQRPMFGALVDAGRRRSSCAWMTVARAGPPRSSLDRRLGVDRHHPGRRRRCGRCRVGLAFLQFANPPGQGQQDQRDQSRVRPREFARLSLTQLAAQCGIEQVLLRRPIQRWRPCHDAGITEVIASRKLPILTFLSPRNCKRLKSYSSTKPRSISMAVWPRRLANANRVWVWRTTEPGAITR